MVDLLEVLLNDLQEDHLKKLQENLLEDPLEELWGTCRRSFGETYWKICWRSSRRTQLPEGPIENPLKELGRTSKWSCWRTS